MAYWLKSFNANTPPVPGVHYSVSQINLLPLPSVIFFNCCIPVSSQTWLILPSSRSSSTLLQGDCYHDRRRPLLGMALGRPPAWSSMAVHLSRSRYGCQSQSSHPIRPPRVDRFANLTSACPLPVYDRSLPALHPALFKSTRAFRSLLALPVWQLGWTNDVSSLFESLVSKAINADFP
jgi:hypothetical protein